MSYCININSSYFFIKEIHHKPLAKLLKDNFPKDFGGCRTSLDRIMQEIGWSFEYDEETDDIVDIKYDRENYYSDHMRVFDVMAPFVENGSYIEFVGEDGDRWRWIFNGKNVKKIEPKISWG